MSISSIVNSIGRLKPHQRTLIAGVLAGTIAGTSALGDSFLTIVVRATLWSAAIALLELTFEAGRGAPLDRRAFVAYLPLACATVALWLAGVTAPHVTRSGSLNEFFATAASLLGLLLVSLIVEARRVTTRDKWLRALRSWWVGFIVLGILYALLGLAPGHSRRSEDSDYEMVWAGMVGALVALTVVMWRDSPQERDSANAEPTTWSLQAPTRTSTPRAEDASTRTPVQPNPASRRATRR
jgi:hypothetical protein